MKRLLISAGTLVFVGAMVVSATGAFFSDTETSTGNTFAAGAIDLLVDAESHYAGLTCSDGVWIDEPNEAFGPVTRPDLLGDECDGSWTQTNLGPEHQFFNLSDIKPGDTGENTISLHVLDNDAWMCADVRITSNDDVTSTEPELGAGDVEDVDLDVMDGELAQNLEFAAWIDDGNVDGWQNSDEDENNNDAGEGDNLFQEGETPLFAPGPASNILNGTTTLALAESGDTPFAGAVTHYIGLAWCAGEFNPDMSCNGEPMGNIAQTDSMTADISFRAEQSRNNPNFTCSGEEEPAPETAALTLDKLVTFSSVIIEGVSVSDFELHINGPGGDQILTDEVKKTGLAPGVYTISEVYSGDPAGVTHNAIFSGSCVEVGATNTATVTLDEADDLTCNITNVISPAAE